MKVTLIEKIRETKDVYSFIFKSEKQVIWEAGQHIFLKIPHPNPDNRGIIRHFTISSAPFEKNISITSRFDIEKGSSFKKALLKLKTGSSVEAFNLRGNFIIKDLKAKYVFIAGGIGITPYRSILLDLSNKNNSVNIILLYGSKDQNIVFKGTLDEIESKYKWLKIHYIIEPQLINGEIIKNKVPDFQERIFYISGPLIMVKIVEGILSKLNISKSSIAKDYFPGYE
jgi:ferredoxin-NADP reductase